MVKELLPHNEFVKTLSPQVKKVIVSDITIGMGDQDLRPLSKEEVEAFLKQPHIALLISEVIENIYRWYGDNPEEIPDNGFEQIDHQIILETLYNELGWGHEMDELAKTRDSATQEEIEAILDSM